MKYQVGDELHFKPKPDLATVRFQGGKVRVTELNAGLLGKRGEPSYWVEFLQDPDGNFRALESELKPDGGSLFWIEVNGKKRYYTNYLSAWQAAADIYKATGVIVGLVEEVQS